jgi:aerobic carbon-monoxide dehydrogenase medium subunit
VKPGPFAYHRPASVEEAVRLLADLGTAAKVLAGGQSLVPLLSMRLAAPGHLVDINQLPGLAYVRSSEAGVRVGALTRQATLERDDGALRAQPLLRQALVNVAHPTIRNRGTVVGSLAHADPSGELTAVLALTGGRVTLASAGGRREVPAHEFFRGVLESDVRPGELAVEAFFPSFPAGTGTAFIEIARRHGDYAVCGVAAAVFPDGTARTAYISMGDRPVVIDPADVEKLDADTDLHATAQYRRHLAGVLTRRALDEASRRAG